MNPEECNEMEFGGCGDRKDGCSTVNYQCPHRGKTQNQSGGYNNTKTKVSKRIPLFLY